MLETLLKILGTGVVLYQTIRSEQQNAKILEYCHLQTELLRDERAEHSRIKAEYLNILEHYITVAAQLPELARLDVVKERARELEVEASNLRKELTQMQDSYLSLSRSLSKEHAELVEKYQKLNYFVTQLLDMIPPEAYPLTKGGDQDDEASDEEEETTTENSSTVVD